MSKLGQKYALIISCIIIVCALWLSISFYLQFQRTIQKVEDTSISVIQRNLNAADIRNVEALAEQLAGDFRAQILSYDFYGLEGMVATQQEAHQLISLSVFDQTGLDLSLGVFSYEKRQVMSIEMLQSYAQSDNLTSFELGEGRIKVTRLLTDGEQIIGGFAFERLAIGYVEELESAQASIHTSITQNETSVLLTIISVSLIAIITGATVSLIVGNRLSLPIKRLAKQAKYISEGNLGRTLPIDRQDEIGELYQAFNDMSISLEKGKRLEERALRNREKRIAAEEANKAKSMFLANMSHEFRTPLNAIIGFSDMLRLMPKQFDVSNKVQDYNTHINTAGKNLLALVNDLLDMSKIEAGKMELFEEEFNLRDVVSEVCATLSPLYQDKSLSVSWDDVPEVFRLFADRRMVAQVLTNLVSNSIKFSEDGGTIKIATSQKDSGDLTLTVSDNGVGIDEETLRSLMQPFAQANGNSVREKEGTGLGLYLVDAMIKLHGGEVSIKSKPGEGTMVSIMMPSDRVLI